MPEFTYLYRKNRKKFRTLPALYAAYRVQTVCNHGGEKYPLRVFRRELWRVLRRTDECVSDSNPRAFIVLHEGKTVLGFADIRTVSKDIIPTDFPYGTVEDFCIAENERGNGCGRMLYERVEELMRDNGTKTVLLTPDPKTGTIFWQKMGYSKTEACIPDTESRIWRKDLDIN